MLTTVESIRFRRALCLLWELLYFASDINIEEMEENDEDEFRINWIQPELQDFDKTTLTDIFGMGVFLLKMHTWSRRAESQFAYTVYPQAQGTHDYRRACGS